MHTMYLHDDTAAHPERSSLIHQPESNGVLRQQTLARRLFGWLLALLLVPTLILIAAALLVGSRSVELFGTLGAWDEVAESGRIVFEAAEPAARKGP